MKQKKLFESKFWETMSDREIAEFQLFEPILCMPFNVFHKALQKTLNRPIQTIELGLNVEGIRSELMNGSPPPTLEETINLIPEEKRILVLMP